MKISWHFKIIPPPPLQPSSHCKISKECHCSKTPAHLIQTCNRQPWCSRCSLVRPKLRLKWNTHHHRMLAALRRPTCKQLARSLRMTRQRSKSPWCKSFSRGTVARGSRFLRPSSMISRNSRLNSTWPTRQTKTINTAISSRHFSRSCPEICRKGISGTKRWSENSPVNQSTDRTATQISERARGPAFDWLIFRLWRILSKEKRHRNIIYTIRPPNFKTQWTNAPHA